MKIVVVAFLLACTTCSLLAQSMSEQYQSGTIVSVDNHPLQGSSGGTDAPLKSGVADHDVSIQVGDTVYVCRYHSVSDQDLSWLRNKDVQVRIGGKVMYVKQSTGKDAKAKIVRTAKATQS